MDIIKLVSEKTSTTGASSESGKHLKAATVQSRQSAPARKAASPTTKKALRAKKQKGNGGRKAIIVLAVIIAVMFTAFVGLGVYANGLDTIFPNVIMEGVRLEGMTVSEAADTLIANNIGTQDDRLLNISLPAGIELSISAKDAGCYLTAPDAAVYAYDACHGGSFISNTLSYIKCIFGGKKLTATSADKLDESYLHGKIDEAVKQASLALMQSNVEIGDESIIVVKGASAVKIDSEKLFDTVKKALVSGNFEDIKYTAETVDGASADKIDLQELYDTVFEEPVDAEYNPETKQATEHVVGRSFDIDGAQKLWDNAQNGDQVVIPLILTEPEITTDKLNSMLFADLLAQKTTTLVGSSSARINNVTHAAASINGVVLNPGEEFSYNKTVGQRTTAAGYQSAGAYSGGQVVSEIGGGICQVSSTLYYCTLISNLQIVDRSCHYFGVPYLPAGLDATVSWPSPDFKFKNNGQYPIKIQASVDKTANALVVKIYGSNPEGIRVEMTTSSWQLEDGYGAQSVRTVYDKNGNVISSKNEAKSRYYYHTSPSPSPSASESPSPSPSSSAAPTPTQPVTPTPGASVEPATGTNITG